MEPLQILGREYSIEILGAAGEPQSVGHLSDALNIPIATCYRRVDQLVSVGLLEESPTDETDTPGATLYRRTTDAVGIRFAPSPSLSAWTCVRQAVGADASTLDVPAGSETPGQARFAPVDAGQSDTAESTERQASVGNDV